MAVDGGFRVGPFDQVGNVRWASGDQVYASFRLGGRETLGTVATQDGSLAVLAESDGFYINEPVLGGRAALFSGVVQGRNAHWLQRPNEEPVHVSEGWQWQVSPDGTRVVDYVRSGEATFVDLRTGAAHRLESPTSYGSNRLDSWAPDGSRYLVQASRDDEAPGFYLLDADGRPAGAWSEPGRYAMWARWSPDSQHVAFLSIPLTERYRKHPEAFFEPELAPRLGVLDVRTGKARYFEAPGRVLAGPLVWSPDSNQVAVRAGALTDDGVAAGIRGERICVADLSTGALIPVSDAVEEGAFLVPGDWAPDSGSLLAQTRWLSGGKVETALLTPGAAPVSLKGEAVWVNDRMLAVVEQTLAPELRSRLTLADRQGHELKTLAEGGEVHSVTVSPDRAHVAFALVTTIGRRMASDPPATHLTVLKVEQ